MNAFHSVTSLVKSIRSARFGSGPLGSARQLSIMSSLQCNNESKQLSRSAGLFKSYRVVVLIK